MKTFLLNFNTTFTAKNPKVRLADDISRLSKREFPMFSDSYASQTYRAFNCDNIIKYQKALGLIMPLSIKIKNTRKTANSEAFWAPRQASSYNPTDEIWLKHIKNSKAGNCYEMSQAALAALFANDYLNSEAVRLGYKSVFTDKKTGLVKDVEYVPLDHVAVVTDMEKGNDEFNPKRIVVDPWLSFVSPKEEANARYKELFEDGFIKNQERKLKEQFIAKNENEAAPDFNIDNYRQDSTFFFMRDTEPPMAAQKRMFAEHVRAQYPNLIVKKSK